MKMMRVSVILRLSGVIGLAFGVFISHDEASAATEAPRHVVLVVADDLGLELGCYGDKVSKTPHLDALAASGTRFSQAFCTTASCSASRSVILSGLQNHSNGHYGHAHAAHHFSSFANTLSLPVRLSKAGYRTARIGKYHVEPADVYRFDRELKADARNPVAMARACADWVRAEPDRPFFLYFCPADPHRDGAYAEEIPGRPNRFGNAPKGRPGVETVTFDPATIPVPAFLPDTPACRAELAQYYQSVARLDQGVGALIQTLRDAGVWDRTMLVFISDNGIAMPGAKTTLYEPGMHLPCLIRNPRQTVSGVVNDALMTWVDVAPTILDYAGALSPDAAKTLQGRSVLPIMDKSHADGWDEAFASHTFHEVTMYYPMRVVRQRQYKLIWNIAHPLPFPFASDLWEAPTWQVQYRQGPQAPYGKRTVGAYIQRPRWELYDLQADPHEIRNLADDPRHAETLRKLQERLRDFQKRTNDPWLLKWDYE